MCLFGTYNDITRVYTISTIYLTILSQKTCGQGPYVRKDLSMHMKTCERWTT